VLNQLINMYDMTSLTVGTHMSLLNLPFERQRHTAELLPY